MNKKKIVEPLVINSEEAEHLVKGFNDPIYFINHVLRIRPNFKENDNEQFKLYDYQKDIINHFTEHHFSQCNGTRQFGMTTLAAAYATWMAVNRSNKKIIVASNNFDNSSRLFEMIRHALANLPKIYGITFLENNKSSVHLNNGTRLLRISSSSGARGHSCNLLIVDNADYCKEDYLGDMLPTIVASEGRAIFAGHTTNFPTITIKWNQVPTRNEAWKTQIIDMIGLDQWNKQMEGV